MRALQFDPIHHRYSVDGAEVPSVTQIIKGAGLMREHNDWQTLRAMRRGTLAHELMALYERGPGDEGAASRAEEHARQMTECFDMEPEVQAAESAAKHLQGWIAYLKATHGTSILIETPVFSQSYWYAGMLDRVIRDHDWDRLVDIKTGPPQPWHRLQLAAYYRALREMLNEGWRTETEIRLKSACTVHTSEDGSYAVHNMMTPLEAHRVAQDFFAIKRNFDLRKSYGVVV